MASYLSETERCFKRRKKKNNTQRIMLSAACDVCGALHGAWDNRDACIQYAHCAPCTEYNVSETPDLYT